MEHAKLQILLVVKRIVRELVKRIESYTFVTHKYGKPKRTILLTTLIIHAKLRAMQDKKQFLPIFFISLAFVLLLFLLGRIGALNFFVSLTQESIFPFAQMIHATSAKEDTTQMGKLQKENTLLSEQLVQMRALQSDNQALRDQFATTNPSSQKLLPAQIVGFGDAVVNESYPENLIIRAESVDGVRKGMVVVIKNELVGIINNVSEKYANILLVSNKQNSFSVKDTSTNALGVMRGTGSGQIEMDNVLLSDTIKRDDLIVTVGNQTVDGNGFPPGLLIGKIVSVNKNPSSLFQNASVVPLVSFDHLTQVFVLLP